MRVVGLLSVLCLLASGCSGDETSDGLRLFELEGEEFDGEWPMGPELSVGWADVSAAVVEAPAVVTVGEQVEVVVELHNPAKAAVSLDPCPVWVAWYGGENDAIMTTLTGDLPCKVGRIEAGERMRLTLTVPSLPDVDCHDGYDPDFVFELRGLEYPGVRAATGIPIRERGFTAPNDCGAPPTTGPPELERT